MADATPQNIDKIFSRVADRGPAALRKLLIGLSFDMLEDLGEHVDRELNFRSASTKNFLGSKKAWVFKVKPNQGGEGFISTIQPKRSTDEILRRQQFGGTFRAEDKTDVIFDKRILIPAKPRRSRRIRARLLPGNIIDSGRGFIRGAAVVLNRGRRAVGFLVDSVTIRPQLDVQDVAEKSILRNIGKQADKIISKELAKK